MKGYVIGEVAVNNATAYEEYRRQVLTTIEKFGGRFLVRGGKAEGLEGAAIHADRGCCLKNAAKVWLSAS